MELTVQPYIADQEAAWDRFVMQESGNGTFLQTRNFLNYHPAGRFEDASLVVTNEHELVHRFHQRVVTLSHGRIVSDVPADPVAAAEDDLSLDVAAFDADDAAAAKKEVAAV